MYNGDAFALKKTFGNVRGIAMTHGRNARVESTLRGRTLNRREILQRSGWGLAGAALIPRALLAAGTVGPVMQRLSTYMSEARTSALPDEVVEKAKRHALDTLGAMISGSELPPGRIALQFAREYGGEKVATIAGSNM